MRSWLAVTAVLLAPVGGASAATPAPPAPAESAPGLQQRLRSALRSPDLSLGLTSAYAIDVRTGDVVFAHNAALALVPASNEKLPVAWTALTRLGRNFRFRTELYGRGMQEGSTWFGDLILKGHGDPTLATGDLSRLARRLAATGISRVTGRILGDESAFDTRRGAAGWKSYWVGDESPPLSALVVDRARGWPALSPPLLAARTLAAALGQAGIEVVGQPGTGRVAVGSATLLATDVSVRLERIVDEMNRDSDNFLAEMLLKQLPLALGRVGTTAGGARIVRGAMSEAGIDVTGVRIVDGSGLSHLNRLTTTAIVRLLVAGSTDPAIGTVFVDSLAVSGRSGTLSRRLTELSGVVRGKTGTTNLSCTLSGFVGDRYAFAVFENGDPVAYWAARAAQDRFVNILASV